MTNNGPLPSHHHHQLEMTRNTKKDVEKRQIVMAFMETQMYMEWEQSDNYDFTFGFPRVEPRKKTAMRDAYWRKDDDRGHYNDEDVKPQKGTAALPETQSVTAAPGSTKRRHYYRKLRAVVMSDAEDEERRAAATNTLDGVLSGREGPMCN